VGGDSLVGKSLFLALRQRGMCAFATTRRNIQLASWQLYFDFETRERFEIPPNVEYVYIIAGATNYDRCEKEPLAHRINVELIPMFAAYLLERGVFVSFISSNSVFGGEQPWPHEDASQAPGIAYAKQKAQAEKLIIEAASRLGAENRLNIVRLTKILAGSTSPLSSWFSNWKCGEIVEPFSDLVFAPISVQFAGKALAVIGEKRISRNLHLSGSQNGTYVDLASKIADKLGVSSHLIKPTTATEKGVAIPFKPKYSGLGMDKTTRLSGISPQKLDEVVDDIILDFNQRENNG